jgi:hypothetical protein
LAIYTEHPGGFLRGQGGAVEEEIRAIGQALHEAGGIELMRFVHAGFASKSGDPGAARNLEFLWDGIGNWLG